MLGQLHKGYRPAAVEHTLLRQECHPHAVSEHASRQACGPEHCSTPPALAMLGTPEDQEHAILFGHCRQP